MSHLSLTSSYSSYTQKFSIPGYDPEFQLTSRKYVIALHHGSSFFFSGKYEETVVEGEKRKGTRKKSKKRA